jgi:hypothetical protein
VSLVEVAVMVVLVSVTVIKAWVTVVGARFGLRCVEYRSYKIQV